MTNQDILQRLLQEGTVTQADVERVMTAEITAIAELLHLTFCNRNHEHECLFYHETNDMKDPWKEGEEHNKWFQLAIDIARDVDDVFCKSATPRTIELMVGIYKNMDKLKNKSLSAYNFIQTVGVLPTSLLSPQSAAEDQKEHDHDDD